MNKSIVLILILLGLIVHIGMIIYFFNRPYSLERRVILSLLFFMIISSIMQLNHTIKDINKENNNK